MKNSNWTGRTPRDMQSAFGPYTDNQIAEDTPPWRGHEFWLALICVGVVALFVAGVI